MSLFEKLNNKRYNLQEVENREPAPPDGTFGVGGEQESFRKKNERKISKRMNKKAENSSVASDPLKKKNVKKGETTGTQTPKRGSTTIRTSKQLDLFTGKPEAPKEVKVKTTYKPRVKKTKVVGSDPTIPGIDDAGTKTTTVKQSDVSKQAKEFTKKINKQNKNKSFFDVTKHKKAREKLIQGRKAYIDPKTNKASKEGIKRYITKARNMASGSNVNNKANQKAAEIIAKSSGKEYADKINQKYGGKLGRKRPSNAKSLEQIQREINAKNPVKPGITGKPIPLKKTSKPSSTGFKNFPGSNVSDKEIQTAIKTGGKKPTANVKKAIKDLDKVIIQPKKGDAQKTARYIRKQIKQNVKKVTTPKVGEVSKAKKILQTYQQQQQQQQPQAGSTTTTRTRTRTYTKPNTGNKSFIDLQKEIEKIKKNLKNPVDQSFGDALKQNQNPSIKKISTPELEKIKPKVTRSTYNYVAPPPKAKQLTKLSKHLLKNKNKYVAATGLALAGGAYLLGNRRLKKTKEKERKALIIANQKKAQKPKELVSVNLFLNKTGTPPGQTKTSSPSYAKPTQKSSNVNRNKFLP